LGVQFFGITEVKGKKYLVMEYVEGINTNQYYSPKEVLHQSEINEMRRQFDILIQNDILPVDIQFQVSRDGKRVVLVDPEYFEYTHVPKKEAEDYFQFFLSYLHEA